jgi:hypothetical protein
MSPVPPGVAEQESNNFFHGKVQKRQKNVPVRAEQNFRCVCGEEAMGPFATVALKIQISAAHSSAPF